MTDQQVPPPDKHRKKKSKKSTEESSTVPVENAETPGQHASLNAPYTGASTFISSLGGPSLPLSKRDVIQDTIHVVESFDTAQIENVRRHLGQTPEVPAISLSSGNAISVPVVGAHSSRPRQQQRGSTVRPKTVDLDPSLPTPTAINQRPVNSQATADASSNDATPLSQTVPDIDYNRHSSILSEKWLSTGQLNDMAKKEGLVYKKGKFSKVEDIQLEHAIADFGKKTGLSEEAIEKIIFTEDRNKGNKETALDFWSFITSALYQRPIIAVYHHIKRIRNPLRHAEGGSGAWTTQQDQALRQAYQQYGPSWEKISQLVLRTAGDCRDRYRNHLAENEKNRSSGKWTAAEEAELVAIVQDMQAKLGDQDGDEIFWTRVSERMGGRRGRQQCAGKWNDQLRRTIVSQDGKARQWTANDEWILFRKVDSLNIRHDSEINWASFWDKDWTFSAHVVQKKWRLLQATISGWETMTHSELMDELRLKFGIGVPSPRARSNRSATVYKSAAIIDDESDANSDTGNQGEADVLDHEQTVPDEQTVGEEAPPKRKKKKRSREDVVVGVDDTSGTTQVVTADFARDERKKKKKRKKKISEELTTDGIDGEDGATEIADVAATYEGRKKKKKRSEAHTTDGADGTHATTDVSDIVTTQEERKRKKKKKKRSREEQPEDVHVDQEGEPNTSSKKKRRRSHVEENAEDTDHEGTSDESRRKEKKRRKEEKRRKERADDLISA